ncbi:low molecular weight protein-tyrosine-phosphatase [Helicobacter ibis]|uniref:protein-tyrosine-phosphatase n=1 Tax=Helicobacter ibis TaxID=2962633 RepID=A0ABT4VDY5_9HELI|nr:low molecular weight protein-tyrosine-phosphatase [Helicobacter ibis]MDA3968918.1 low molecular weight phosphotyrosine protein phosphatase [Helicobacter ibis]
MKRILFVCLGNICRSPLAEGIARELADKRGLSVVVDSAGTASYHVGSKPDDRSILVAKNYGIDISMLRSRQVSVYGDSEFDLIVAMDRSNFNDLKRMGFSNVVLMGDYGLGGEDIPDPYYYRDISGFEKVYSMLERAINTMYDELEG